MRDEGKWWNERHTGLGKMWEIPRHFSHLTPWYDSLLTLLPCLHLVYILIILLQICLDVNHNTRENHKWNRKHSLSYSSLYPLPVSREWLDLTWCHHLSGICLTRQPCSVTQGTEGTEGTEGTHTPLIIYLFPTKNWNPLSQALTGITECLSDWYNISILPHHTRAGLILDDNL